MLRYKSNDGCMKTSALNRVHKIDRFKLFFLRISVDHYIETHYRETYLLLSIPIILGSFHPVVQFLLDFFQFCPSTFVSICPTVFFNWVSILGQFSLIHRIHTWPAQATTWRYCSHIEGPLYSGRNSILLLFPYYCVALIFFYRIFSLGSFCQGLLFFLHLFWFSTMSHARTLRSNECLVQCVFLIQAILVLIWRRSLVRYNIYPSPLFLF